MKIYGVALLAFCFLIGKILGTLLGNSIGIDGDVGGVGFAMLLLMWAQSFFNKKSWFNQETIAGISFWSSIYIPIVVAMAATSNVRGALSGGLGAVLIGIVVTIGAFVLVPFISKIGDK